LWRPRITESEIVSSDDSESVSSLMIVLPDWNEWKEERVTQKEKERKETRGEKL